MDAAFWMEYLHLENIIHFYLKGDNLLIIPGMTAPTKYYVTHQNMFQTKVESDYVLQEKHVKNIIFL